MLSLIAGDMILYIEKTKDATRTLLQFINEFGKVTGYKVNTQNLLNFYKLTRGISESIQNPSMLELTFHRLPWFL